MSCSSSPADVMTMGSSKWSAWPQVALAFQLSRYVNSEANELCSKRGQPVELVLCVPAFECEVLAFDPSQFAEALVDTGLQPGPLYTRARGEKAYLIDLPRLLRPRAERQRGGRGAQKYDECAALHSLTSSATVFLPLPSIVSSGPPYLGFLRRRQARIRQAPATARPNLGGGSGAAPNAVSVGTPAGNSAQQAAFCGTAANDDACALLSGRGAS